MIPLFFLFFPPSLFCYPSYSFVLSILVRAALSEKSPARWEEVTSPCCLVHHQSSVSLS